MVLLFQFKLLISGQLADCWDDYSIEGRSPRLEDSAAKTFKKPINRIGTSQADVLPNYIIATLSNGNVSMLLETSKNGGLPWDHIISAELFLHHKPDAEVYRGAVDMLGYKPEEVMMVAAHTGDLQAAQACGLKTGFVARPLENGAGGGVDRGDGRPFDVVASDFVDLAAKLF